MADETESMVERVARILEPQAWAALGVGDSLAYKHRRTSSLRKARKAIEAMRIPTMQMISAVDKAEENGPWCAAAFEHMDWDDAWTVAIDEALK